MCNDDGTSDRFKRVRAAARWGICVELLLQLFVIVLGVVVVVLVVTLCVLSTTTKAADKVTAVVSVITGYEVKVTGDCTSASAVSLVSTKADCETAAKKGYCTSISTATAVNADTSPPGCSVTLSGGSCTALKWNSRTSTSTSCSASTTCICTKNRRRSLADVFLDRTLGLADNVSNETHKVPPFFTITALWEAGAFASYPLLLGEEVRDDYRRFIHDQLPVRRLATGSCDADEGCKALKDASTTGCRLGNIAKALYYGCYAISFAILFMYFTMGWCGPCSKAIPCCCCGNYRLQNKFILWVSGIGSVWSLLNLVVYALFSNAVKQIKEVAIKYELERDLLAVIQGMETTLTVVILFFAVSAGSRTAVAFASYVAQRDEGVKVFPR